MTKCTGYLVIADISGYTAFMTTSEQEHSSGIIGSLLGSIVEQVGDPMHLLRVEGDAVLAYSEKQRFPTGETFLGICENIYNAFATRRSEMIVNTACGCRACANIENLDLKIIAHHGSFDMMQIGPVADISGADVILVHRMAKSDVKEVTGIHSYAMFSDAAAKAMDVDAALKPYTQTIEHFGDVNMQVYDLAAAWEHFRDSQERVFIDEQDAVAVYRHTFAHPKPVVWQAMVSPEMKRVWMGMIDVTVDRPQGRIGPGSQFHCAHEAMEFRYRIVDWRPFDYFTKKTNHPLREGFSFWDTYSLTDVNGGTEMRMIMAASHDTNGKLHSEATLEVTELLGAFWPTAFSMLGKLLDGKH